MHARTTRKFLLPLLLANLLAADTFSVVRTVRDGRENTLTYYLKAREFRMDSAGFVTIQTRAMTYQIYMKARQYALMQPMDAVAQAALQHTRGIQPVLTGKRVSASYEVEDTGETRTLFGYKLRHLRVRGNFDAEPGSCQLSRRIEQDGWYPDRALRIPLFEARLTVGSPCGDPVIDVNKPHFGTPFLVSETETVFGPDGQPLGQPSTTTREVLDFSDKPLPDSLFEPPAGFQKVAALYYCRTPTLAEQLEADWNLVVQAITSWFNW